MRLLVLQPTGATFHRQQVGAQPSLMADQGERRWVPNTTPRGTATLKSWPVDDTFVEVFSTPLDSHSELMIV